MLASGSGAGRTASVKFYSRQIFPWLCDLVLDRPPMARHRRELLARAGGEILEIGFGTGLNLLQYPPHVRRIVVVEPNPGMHRKARRRIAQSGVEVDRRVERGESLPFADGSFDCVVSTFTLCSVGDVGRVLGEVHRVLRPGGQFLFLEHGLSPDPRVQTWQRRLNRLEQWLADGCHLDRDIRRLVETQPFRQVEVDEFYLEQAPRTHGYLFRGVATK
jgi:ubiquinone/menaquinone biosynthesis C-methylase UbiE